MHRLGIQIELKRKASVFLFSAAYFILSFYIGYKRYWYHGSSGFHFDAIARLFVYQLPVLALPFFRIRLRGPLERLCRILFLPAAAFLCLWLWEVMNGNSLFNLPLSMRAINYALMLLVFLSFFVVLHRVRRSVPIAFTFMTLCGYLYRCVYLFRGTPLLPYDLAAIRTAVNVAGGYTYPFEREHFLAICLCATVALLSRMLEKRPSPRAFSRLGWAASLCACVIGSYSLFYTPVLENLGVNPSMWPDDLPGLARRQGSLAQFSVQLHNLFEPVPAGYDPAGMQKILEGAPIPQSLAVAPPDRAPNIIAVMNESFSDLSDALGVQTDVDPLPFFHSLRKNTIKGDLYVSVRGGTTCNTEYEFLTGNLLSPNRSSVAFYQIVRSPMPSLARLLKAQGYTAVGMHPAPGINYNRTQIYADLGFDSFLDIAAFDGAEYFRHPSFISDRACYQKIRSLLEEKEADEPLFVFNVTMQNHSGYATGQTRPTVSLTVPAAQEDELNEYLRAVQQSDSALGEFVSYLESFDEPTVLLFFGDHQPRLSYDGEAALPTVRTQTKTALREYVTPYFIWANYELQDVQMPETSANYLSSLLLSAAGLPVSPYEAYALSIREQYPVVTRFGFTDAQGSYTPFALNEAIPQPLRGIYGAVYNRAFDEKRRLPLYDQPLVPLQSGEP